VSMIRSIENTNVGACDSPVSSMWRCSEFNLNPPINSAFDQDAFHSEYQDDASISQSQRRQRA
jgi:hypothetical protein